MTDGEEERFAEALFIASSQTRDLRLSAGETPREIAFSDLVWSLVQPHEPGAADILAAAADHAGYASALEVLARRFAVAEFPPLAAASDGALPLREQDGMRLRLERSLSHGGPVYLLIERTGGREVPVPRLLIGVRPGAPPVLAALPEAASFPVQLLLGADTPILETLRDPDSRFFLT